MQYKAKENDEDTAALIGELEPVVGGLGFSLVELNLFRRKGTAQVRLVVAKPLTDSNNASGIGTDELSRIHRAVLPRLEFCLEGRDLYVEVSSPGIDRLIKEGAEFRYYIGKPVKYWLVGGDNWNHGILRGLDEEKITLETAEGIKEMKYETIVKAKLGTAEGSSAGRGR